MTNIATLVLQNDAGSNAAGGAMLAAGGMFLLFYLAILVVFVVGMWRVFEKAGQPGWAAIIPIYNAYILLKIAGRPGWWLLLCLIPLVNVVIFFIVSMDVAKAFGQSAVFGIVLLFLFSFIGYLVLGFGNYRYTGTATA